VIQRGSTNYRSGKMSKPVNRVSVTPNSGLFGKNIPHNINHNIAKEESIHPAIQEIYRHVFRGGTVKQINLESIIVLMLEPITRVGVFRRKVTKTPMSKLHDRYMVFMHKHTGYVELRKPNDWLGIDIKELEEKLVSLGL
jgi:hypothetical protein